MIDPKRIKERYAKAKAKAELWYSKLQKCYELTMPNKANFTIKKQTPGQQKTQYLYDSTAALGLSKYAANLQNLLFGVKDWAKLVPGKLVKEGKTNIDLSQAEKQCEDYTELFFEKLNQSNFQMAVYQCIMEMGISTGVLLVNEGDFKQPFKFTAIPLHEVSIEEGPDNTIQNVYREYKMTASVIAQTWPESTVSKDLENKLKKNPAEEVSLLEGTVFDPSAPKGKQYCYFVMEKDKDGFLFYEERSYSPWIVFRPKVIAGELFGRGIIYDLLPSIKELNLTMEYLLRSASFNANPIFMVQTGSEINPYTMRLNPGSIVPVQPGPSQNAISQLSITSNANEMLALREELRGTIQESLNLNPIGDTPTAGDPSQTATEANLRNQEYIKQNQSMYNRLQYELNQPLFKVCWHILYRLGMVPAPVIDGQHLAVEFNSPVQDMARQEDIQKAVQASSIIQQILGPQLGEYGVMFGMDVTEVPEFVLKKLGVSYDLSRDALGKAKMLQAVQALTGQNPQQPQGMQPSPAAQPQPNKQQSFVGV